MLFCLQSQLGNQTLRHDILYTTIVNDQIIDPLTDDASCSEDLCCEILKYSQVYESYRSIVGQERGRTHRDLYERRKIKSNLNQTNPNLV